MKIKIPTKESKYKLVDAKSSFTAYIYPINNEQEVSPILKKTVKNNKKAAHIPYAYHITKYENNRKKIYEKYSDDGEPTKTAGYPVLRLLQNKKITNVLIIVVRIFGGIKLGMAGLMKAFKTSADRALENNKIIERELCEEFVIKTNLQEYSKIEILLKKYKIDFQHSFDSDAVRITAFTPIEHKELKEKIVTLLK